MKVIAYKEYGWFLLQDNNSLYLDVNCEMSFLGYSHTIQLNSTEEAEYYLNGNKYIDKLASDINYSAPIARGSTSIYKHRKVSEETSHLISKAISQWHKDNETIEKR